MTRPALEPTAPLAAKPLPSNRELGARAAPDPLRNDLPRRLHLLGAGGAGLSGAARILLAQGHDLSGHDRAESPFVRSLREAGMAVAIGGSSSGCLAPDVEAVVRSAAIGKDDPQVVEAERRGLPIYKYSEVLPRLAPAAQTIAVAGTHGKTTTSWMLHYALSGAATGEAFYPGALVGGTDRNLGSNAVVPAAAGWFVVEACEYDRSFLQLAPAGAVITNIEPDHLDYYGSALAVEEAFARFAARVHPDGRLVLGADVPGSVEAAARCPVQRLGRELKTDLLGERDGAFRFRLRGAGWATPEIQLAVPGEFNVENAALALALAVEIQASSEPRDIARAAAHGLDEFVGVERRFEPWGDVGGVRIVHDYAHHPTEVRATLEAARRALSGRPLHVLFQPHQASRTARFLEDFVEALRGVDGVVIADVYGARAHIDDQGAGAEELVRRLRRAGVDATLGGSPQESTDRFVTTLPTRAAALVLGAGDIDGIQDELLSKLALRGTLEGRARQ